MSGRAVFGDFAAAAHQHLGTPTVFRTAIARGGDVAEIRRSQLRAVVAMSRHVQDTTAAGPRPSAGGCGLAGWDGADLEAREALIRATAALYGDTIGSRRPDVAAGSELARRIDAATGALVCGRDLLQTHLAHGPRDGLRFRASWMRLKHRCEGPWPGWRGPSSLSVAGAVAAGAARPTEAFASRLSGACDQDKARWSRW